MHYPLGPVKIEFDASTTAGAGRAVTKVVIDKTLEDQDTMLTTNLETFKVFMDQLSGAYIAQYFTGEESMNFTCSVLLDPAQLPNLTSAYQVGAGGGVAYNPAGKNVMFGTLKIHPLAAGDKTDFDINGFKVSCTPTIQGSFKTQDTVRVDLLFEFAGCDDSAKADMFGILCTFGNYSSTASQASE
ncbi:MAG: hypothetical protein ACRCTW_07680 [Lactococcus garvieae]